MSKSAKLYQEPTHDEIAACAQRIYEMEGRPEGKAKEHWLQAEAQLVAERKAQASKPSAKTAPTPTPQTNLGLEKTRDPAWQNTARGRQNLHTN